MVNFAQKHKGRILNKGPYFAHGHFADAETWPFLQKRHQTGRGYIYILIVQKYLSMSSTLGPGPGSS
jgi:hypothetical protein